MNLGADGGPIPTMFLVLVVVINSLFTFPKGKRLSSPCLFSQLLLTCFVNHVWYALLIQGGSDVLGICVPLFLQSKNSSPSNGICGTRLCHGVLGDL